MIKLDVNTYTNTLQSTHIRMCTWGKKTTTKARTKCNIHINIFQGFALTYERNILCYISSKECVQTHITLCNSKQKQSKPRRTRRRVEGRREKCRLCTYNIKESTSQLTYIYIQYSKSTQHTRFVIRIKNSYSIMRLTLWTKKNM